MRPSEAAVTETKVDSPPRSPFRSSADRWAHWLTLALLLVLSVVVRLRCLSNKPFWFDECFSAEVARIDWHNFAHLLWWREANMSLYYVLLRAWMHFGQSEFFIRSLSVWMAVATVPAIYWLALNQPNFREINVSGVRWVSYGTTSAGMPGAMQSFFFPCWWQLFAPLPPNTV